MRKNWKIVLTTTAVLTALGMGSTLYAQSERAAPQSGASMMPGGHGEMSGMMNMMGQMSQMMEGCNEMMKNMNQGHAARTPKEGQKSEQKR